MRSTLNISDDLMVEAQSLTKIKNKTTLITLALKTLIEDVKIKRLLQMEGMFPLDINLETLRQRHSNG